MDVSIREIPFGSPLYERARRFREDVLRLPLGLVLSAQDVDGEDHQIHVAALGPNNAVLGTVVLKPITPELVKLRQMAVAPTVQRTGMGKDLVRFAEHVARSKGFKSIEMHARISAKAFYEKLGYHALGDE